MTPPLMIRRATLTDLHSLWHIEKASFTNPWSLWCFLSELTNPLSTILVAGPPPPQPWESWGYIIFWLAAQEMHILNLATHPHKRRLGIARALLAESLKQARQQGATTAWLEVRPSNHAALALYDSFGFQKTGVRPKYYEDNQEDAWILAFFFDTDNHLQLTPLGHLPEA